MAYLNEQLGSLSISDLANESVCCTFILNKGICVQGYKKIFELSTKKIVLMIKTGERLEISGENLEIKEIATSEISVSGVVKNICVL